MAATGKRRFGAYGSIDRKYRQWRYLPSVRHSTGVSPDGNHLIYWMNDTTIEIGSALTNTRGAVGVGGLVMALSGIGLAAGVLWLLLFTDGMFVSMSGIDFILGWMLILISIVLFPLATYIGSGVLIGAFFGYVDAPVRFDRARRKVYVWCDGKDGPDEYDWDAVKVVTQDVRGPTQVATSFKSVLLVDEDEHGEVRLSRKLPRIVQIGAVSASQEQALQTYEFIRLFMERGPAALPPVSEYLLMRRLGLRTFVDVLGMMSGSPVSRIFTPRQRPGDLPVALAIIAGVALLSPVLLVFQIANGIAMHTCRTPHWPEAFEAMAAEGGPLRPPPGAVPDYRPLQAHEKAIAALWVLCALAGWAWFLGR